MTAATIPQTRRNRGAGLWLVLLAGLALIALPPLNGHAKRRHSRTAWSAHWYLSEFDPNDCPPDEPDCKKRLFVGTQEDGRTAHILRLPKLPGKPVTWAVVIVGGAYLVTAFLSQDRKSVRTIKERCE